MDRIRGLDAVKKVFQLMKAV